MEDILGGRSDPARFSAFLSRWEAILARRIDEAVAVFSTVDGLRGLVLAGSVGRGQPWPLSDIDFLAIYDDDRIPEALAEIERRLVPLHARWLDEGWWTGVDIGKLAFGRQEVTHVLAQHNPPLAQLLSDDRWYHSLDKGYQGRPVFDIESGAADLSRWLTTSRFHPDIVRLRLHRERTEVEAAHRLLRASIEREDAPAATHALRTAAKWLRIWFLEQWGRRDASLARIGTHFESLAHAHDRPDLIDIVNRLDDLDDEMVERRMGAAPEWVWEWHDRAWRARRLVGEAVTPVQHARDVLRVCAIYELRRIPEGPFPSWLAIPTDIGALAEKATLLTEIISGERPVL